MLYNLTFTFIVLVNWLALYQGEEHGDICSCFLGKEECAQNDLDCVLELMRKQLWTCGVHLRVPNKGITTKQLRWFLSGICVACAAYEMQVCAPHWPRCTMENVECHVWNNADFLFLWRYTVRVYNISWALKHQLKLLVELVPIYGIRSQCDKRPRVQISTTPHLKCNI